MSRIQIERRDEVYRIYISDSMKAIMESIGVSVHDRYVDLADVKNIARNISEPKESAEDIIARMKKKMEDLQ